MSFDPSGWAGYFPITSKIATSAAPDLADPFSATGDLDERAIGAKEWAYVNLTEGGTAAGTFTIPSGYSPGIGGAGLEADVTSGGTYPFRPAGVIADTGLVNFNGSVDVSLPALDEGVLADWTGFLLRYTDSSNWLAAVIQYDHDYDEAYSNYQYHGTLKILKYESGTLSVLAEGTPFLAGGGFWKTLLVSVADNEITVEFPDTSASLSYTSAFNSESTSHGLICSLPSTVSGNFGAFSLENAEEGGTPGITAVPPQVFINLGGLIPGSDDWWFNVASDGADIRVVDENDIELEIRRIAFDKSGKTGLLQVATSGSSLSDISSTTWKIYAGKSGASFPTYDVFSDSSSPIAAYDFSQDPSGSSPQLLDVTGNSHDGETTSSMSSGDRIDGQLGKAWTFDGSHSVDVPHDSVLSLSLFSVYAWVSCSSFSNYRAICCKMANTTGDRRNYEFDVRQSTGKTNIGFTTAAFTYHELASTAAISTDVTTCVVGTYDGSNLKNYIDGSLDSTSSYSGTPDTGTEPLRIAALRGDNPYYFTGSIHYLAIFNRALSADEISTMHANESVADGIWIAGSWSEVTAPPPSGTIFRRNISRRIGSRCAL